MVPLVGLIAFVQSDGGFAYWCNEFILESNELIAGCTNPANTAEYGQSSIVLDQCFANNGGVLTVSITQAFQFPALLTVCLSAKKSMMHLNLRSMVCLRS